MKRVNKKSIICSSALALAFIFIICAIRPSIKESKVKAENEAEIQALRKTPAAEYCQNNGGILQIKTDKTSGIYGICNFKDGSNCEILEYLRGECLSTSEKIENEESYCSNPPDCENDENKENEEYEDLSSRIENMNSIEYEDEEILDGDNLDEFDIDSLYDYYENEFNNTGDRNREQLTGNLEEEILNLEPQKSNENQTLSSCEKIHGNIVDGKCFLSNGIEIVF